MLPKNNSTNTILGSFTSFVDINQGMATSPDPYLEDWDRQFEQFFNGKLPLHPPPPAPQALTMEVG